MRNAALRCGWQDPKQGYCTACNDSHGPIFLIDAADWQTRLCEGCLAQMIEDSGLGKKKPSKSISGRKISRRQALKGLGDPKTWPVESAKLQAEFEEKPPVFGPTNPNRKQRNLHS